MFKLAEFIPSLKEKKIEREGERRLESQVVKYVAAGEHGNPIISALAPSVEQLSRD